MPDQPQPTTTTNRFRRIEYQRHIRDANAWQAKAMTEMCALSDVMRKIGVLP